MTVRHYYNEIDPFAAQWLRNLIAARLIPAGDVDTRSIVDVAADDLAGYRQCHFFAGIGGWALAARLAGWAEERELWTGSCPCQPFSVAGKGAGTADDRHLWPHLHRLIRARRPAVFMGEQVAAAVGKYWLDGMLSDLEGDDYTGRAVVLPACAVNAPHGRDRIWVVAYTSSPGLEKRISIARVLREVGGEPEGQDTADDACAVGHAHLAGAGQGREQRGGEQRRAGVDSKACAVGHAESIGCHIGSGQDTARHRQAAVGDADPGATCDSWAGAEWIIGHDGKARRAKPGIRLLAYGVSGRMAVVRTDEQTGAEVSHWYNRIGALRCFGNGIVPEEGAEVIGAFMDCMPELEQAA